ncbi:DUF5681 domain-containing protein [Tsuneonella sp. HG222]
MAIVSIAAKKAAAQSTSLPPVRKRTRPVPQPDRIPPAESVIDPPATEPDYTVGYGKPPKHSQFKAGQSGNPKGRPKAAKGLNLLVRDTLTQKVAVRTAKGEKKISRIEAVLQKTVEQAMKGNPRALAELLKLYANAVPDQKHDAEHCDRDEDLTATDIATLEELRQLLIGEQEQTR